LGFSNHGKRAHATAFNREELNGRLIFKEFGLRPGAANVADPDTLLRLAFREGIGVYAARSKKGNRRCYYTGQYYPKPDPHPNRLHLSGVCGPGAGNFALPYRLTHGTGRKAEAKQRAWLKNHPFPSLARPVLDMSSMVGIQTRPKGYPRTSLPQDWSSIAPLAGVAVDRVVPSNCSHSLIVMRLSQCQ
jgi:hypothetical protein